MGLSEYGSCKVCGKQFKDLPRHFLSVWDIEHIEWLEEHGLDKDVAGKLIPGESSSGILKMIADAIGKE